MKLTRKDNPEEIKHYGHVDRARGWGVPVCDAGYRGANHTCTRRKGHPGPHVAHGLLGRVVAVWDPRLQDRAAEPRGLKAPRGSTRTGVRRRKPAPSARVDEPGALGTLKSVLGHVLSSPNEILFVLLFLVFLKFAIDIFLM